jgi:hypothetical protein
MRPSERRPEKRTSALEVRVFYSVAELARAGNVPAYRLLRLLRRNGVTFLSAGRALYVTLTEIRRKIPPLWESLCAAEELRRGAGGQGSGSRDRRPDEERPPVAKPGIRREPVQ